VCARVICRAYDVCVSVCKCAGMHVNVLISYDIICDNNIIWSKIVIIIAKLL